MSGDEIVGLLFVVGFGSTLILYILWAKNWPIWVRNVVGGVVLLLVVLWFMAIALINIAKGI